MKPNSNLALFINSVTNSYSQIFFSNNRVFALMVMLVSFFDIYAGLSGILSVVITNLLAYRIGLDKYKIAQGYYGFNSLLVGIGMGIYFAPGTILYCVLFFSGVLCLIISVTTEGVVGKYGLPNLSLPFVFTLWIVMVATREFHALGISERWIYSLNDLYTIGGKKLVDIYEWWNNIPIAKPIKTYFFSLGAIVFQYNLLSGIFIALGLLIYSRIAFSLSVLGYFTAYVFYILIGAQITEAGYSYIGFNYILTAIAIGGFFIIPGPRSYLWVIFIIPVVAIISISFSALLSVFRLPVYALPFNIAVLMFLYMLKFRIRRYDTLQEVLIQHNKPERNLYSFKNHVKRFRKNSEIDIQLPFHGEWFITQGHDGEITHRGGWKHALDFEIADENNKTFKGAGNYPEDYYCYGKTIIAPAAGTVIEIVDDIPDNIIGEENRNQNWGNTIIIKHTNFLYSKLSHLKPCSFEVTKGQNVHQGQALAKCGNSGRSPVPHLHFQLQATPYIGSRTIEYPFTSYIKKNKNSAIKFYGIPMEGDIIHNILPAPALKNAFNLTPGKVLRFNENHKGKAIKHTLEAKADIYGKTYLYCDKTNSYAYYRCNEKVLSFEHFKGNKNSFLYEFYLAFYRVQTGLYPKLEINDYYPVNKLFSNSLLLKLQDFIAPFYIFLEAKYKMVYEKVVEDFTETSIHLQSTAIVKTPSGEKEKVKYKTVIDDKGIDKIWIHKGKTTKEIRCIKEEL